MEPRFPWLETLWRNAGRPVSLQRRWRAYWSDSSSKADARADFVWWVRTTFLFANRRSADPLPWFTFPFIRWLKAFLKHDMSVFEWGSGGSTVFFARRVRSVVSVEHNESWYQRMGPRLAELNLRNSTLLHVPSEGRGNGISPAVSEMSLYESSDPGSRDRLYYRYVRSILDYPDKSFDVIVVDGRARVGCLHFAESKIRRGGIIVLDNSDRKQYAPGLQRLQAAGWGLRHFEGPVPNNAWPAFWRTTVLSRTPGT